MHVLRSCVLAIAQIHAEVQGHSLPIVQLQPVFTSLLQVPGDWKFGLIWLEEDAF